MMRRGRVYVTDATGYIAPTSRASFARGRPVRWWGYCSGMGKRRSVVIDGEVVPNLRQRQNSDGTTSYDVTRTEYRKLRAHTHARPRRR
jgi:hypothetical protein